MRWLARFLGHVWAAPVTLIGLLVSIACVPIGVELHHGIVNVYCRWLIPWWLPLAGQTWGDVVLTREPIDGASFWAHELVHRDQCHTLGILMIPLYILGLWSAWLMPDHRYYEDHFLECQAQKIARRRIR
jgi:hypothetical protein